MPSSNADISHNHEKEPGVPSVPERQLSPELIANCVKTIEFFLDKPGFRIQRNEAGVYARQELEFEREEWSAVVMELRKESGLMYTASSQQPTSSREKIRNDIIGIYPEVLLKGKYPYCTGELKHSVQIKSVKPETKT